MRPYRHPPARYGRRHHYVQYALPDRWLSSDQDQQHYVLHYSSWFQWIKTLCRIPANFLCTCANLPILWSTLHTGCQDFKGKGGQWLPRESKQCWTEKQSIRVAWREAAVCWFAYCENKRASATFSRPHNCSWHWTYFLNMGLTPPPPPLLNNVKKNADLVAVGSPKRVTHFQI